MNFFSLPSSLHEFFFLAFSLAWIFFWFFPQPPLPHHFSNVPSLNTKPHSDPRRACMFWLSSNHISQGPLCLSSIVSHDHFSGKCGIACLWLMSLWIRVEWESFIFSLQLYIALYSRFNFKKAKKRGLFFPKMAKAASLADSLGKHLECAVCLDQYTEPKVLPCLHSFCKRCLQRLLTREGAECKISCPTCRSSAKVCLNTSLVIFKIQRSLLHWCCR